MTTGGDKGRTALLEEAIRRRRAGSRVRATGLPARPPEEPALLGELQRGLWLTQQLNPDSAAYHLVSAFRPKAALDPAALERGFDAIVRRHRLLRSTFPARRGQVRQIIHPAVPAALERLAAAPGEATDRAVREARRPFDLERGPLVRLLLIEEPAGRERLLALVLHHLLADERSVGVLWRELARGYAGRPLAADEEPQYDDYVHWRLDQDPDRRAADLAYWRDRLATPPEDLDLPFVRSAGPALPPSGRLLRRQLDGETPKGIRRLAAATATTPYIAYAYAFRLLLHRLTGGRDVAFASPVSRRSHPATARMIGYFLNSLVIEGQIDEALPVGDALRRFGAEVRERLAHASVPVDVLVEELAPPRRPDRHPVFQTMFVYQEVPAPPTLGGVRLEPVALDLGDSKFDLTLFVSARDGTVEVAVEYRADRYEERWMRRLIDQYATLVAGLVEDHERTVVAVPLLPPEELEDLRARASGAQLRLERTPLVPMQILDQAERTPSAPAMIHDGEIWRYSDLERAGRAVASELSRRGVEPGDRVGLFLPRSHHLVAGVLGTQLAGAAYVPLDPAYPAERNRVVVEDAEVAAVVTTRELAARLPESSPQPIAIDEEADAAVANSTPLPALDGELPAYLLYTSGSTGRPKGVVVTHHNLLASVAARFAYYETPPGRFLLLPSLAFDSSVAGLFWTLAGGGALVVPRDEEAVDPRALARIIARDQVTSLLCVPSLYAHLLTAGGESLRCLESVIVAGESCPPRLVARHFGLLPATRLFNEYGPTEATVWAAVAELAPRDAERTVAIGEPIPGVTLEVLDSRGRPLPAGVPGQGWISGPTVAAGYWRRPALTEERFLRRDDRRAYASGDRLSWTTDGRLLFHGRLDEQIKLRGFRIEPGEIEAALQALPGVEQAAVVAREGESLTAFVVGSGRPDGWREALARRLPEFMLPGHLVELAELPLLPNGKVDRGRLRRLASTARQSSGEEEPILDDRERTLASLWRGLLRRSDVAPNDNFFQLGGHSLLVVEMTSAIERDFGVALTPAEVFQGPTIRQLARRIERKSAPGAATYAHLFPIQPGGHGSPLVFAIPHFFTEMIADRFRGERPVYGLRGVSLRSEGNRGRWPTMRELGEEMVDEIQRRFPAEPCLIAGYSFGATMAFETVRQMEERGLPVERLYLIAPMPLDTYRLGPIRVRIDGLRRPVAELSIAEALARFVRDNHPLTRPPYQRAWRMLAIQPWRRLLCLAGRVRTAAGLGLTPRVLHADVRLERFRLHTGYRPGVVRTPAVIFNAREPSTDAAATWRPFFRGPLTVHPTPDPHLGDESIRDAKELILHHLRDLEES